MEEYVAALSTPEAMSAALAWNRANVADRVLNTPQVGAITVPTLFVWSDGDFAICRDVAEATGGYIDAPYRFAVIEGVNHWLAENASERMNELLLEQVRGGA